MRGNRLPYAPRHVYTTTIGYERRGASVNFSLEHVGEQFADSTNQRTPSPDGRAGTIAKFTTFGAAFQFPLGSEGASLFLSAANLTDSRHIVSRVDGIHAARPRQVYGGVRWEF